MRAAPEAIIPTSPRRLRAAAALLALALLAVACDDTTEPDTPEARVSGTVRDAQSNTRLFFYDQDLQQLSLFGVQVRSDGSYGPLAFFDGTFFGAGTASGFTTGRFVSFNVTSADRTLTVDFDLNPITVPLQVGNRWTYDDETPAGTSTVEVAIVAEQPAENVPAVFTVVERRGDAVSVYYLARDASGIRKSADPVIADADELLLKLPATLGSTWSTADFATGAPLQKRIKALVCEDSGCTETNDFTIAREPSGIFMSISVIHTVGEQAFVDTFSDIGLVDSFVLNTATGEFVSQRKLRAFTPGMAP